jgi:hypothetical protein
VETEARRGGAEAVAVSPPELKWKWYCQVHGDKCPLLDMFGVEWFSGTPRWNDGRYLTILPCLLTPATVLLPFIVNGEECYGPWCGAHCGRFD